MGGGDTRLKTVEVAPPIMKVAVRKYSDTADISKLG